MSSEAAPLRTYGSSDVARSQLSDGVVLRDASPWSPSVIALLQHLESVRFEGAPRSVDGGFSADGREAVTFLEGTSAHPSAWQDETVGEIGALLRRVHTATATFRPPADAVWQPWFGRELPGSHPVIGHCDTGPWNVIVNDAQVALIDWEFAGPVDAMWDLAQTAWLNAQLHDDDIAERMGLPSATKRARQLRLLVDGYELNKTGRAELVNAMISFAVLDSRQEAILHNVNPDSTDAVDQDGNPVMWAITWRTRSAGWMIKNRRLLERALL